MALSAEIYVNWMPRTMGSMMLRPGLQHVGSTLDDARSRHIEFDFGIDDTALVELTDGKMRVRVDDQIVTRPAVSSTFYDWDTAAFVTGAHTDSLFPDLADVDRWKDNDESGGISDFAAGGYMSLLGNGTASAIRDRSVAVTGANVGVEHVLSIVVTRGQAILRLGSSLGGDEYLGDRTLRQGFHSIAITPTADFFVRLSNGRDITALMTIGQAAGDMVIDTPWTEANLPFVRQEQSGDVIFLACKDVAQKRIERQGATSPRSWSLVDYLPEDGPFLDLNTGPNRLKFSVLTGDGTLTAERPFFKGSNVGSLFRLTSAGQEVTKRIQAQNTFSDTIRVTGIGTGRVFSIEITGPTYTVSTVTTLQRSVGSPGDWADVLSWTGILSPFNYSDTLDNQIIFYRIGVKTGDFTALDDLTAKLTFSAGSITGVVRATAFLTSTTMSASVLTDLGKADQFTQDWSEGAWSPRRGYPSSVCLYDGRLYWAGKDNIWGSGPDLFDSFDDTVEGDARTIRKSLGAGPVDSINWLLPVLHLLVGAPAATQVAKASSFDEPLTQTKFGLKPVSGSGTAPVAAARVDTSGVFVSRDSTRVIELSYDGASYTYVPQDLTAVIPEIGLPGGFTRVAVQRHPDTRLHFVRADGTVCVLLFDKIESVTCWLKVTTDGEVEDVVILPGETATPREDRVYYQVKRTIGGVTKRYLEKWSLESQGQGAADTRLVDCHVTGTGAGSAVITGLDHIEAKTVNLWGNGKDLGSYTVASGSITASEAVTGPYAVGLDYMADWMSAKLAVASQAGAPLDQLKIVKGIGVVLADTHAQGLKMGQDFDHLDNMPLIEKGKRVPADYIWTAYDQPMFPINGTWTTDARICLRAQSPRPCTVLGIVVGVEGHDKI